MATVLALKQPRQQSAQEYLRPFYESLQQLQREGNVVTVMWILADDENKPI
jgi:hypothetical protein